MKDEIKEINLSEMLFNRDERLLDYITNLQKYYNDNINKYEELLLKYSNLQQENERLKFQLENQQIISSKYRMRRNIYKSRCEKAIEYIKEAIENDDYFEDDIATDISEPTYDKYVNSSSLLNILQNGSDSQC